LLDFEIILDQCQSMWSPNKRDSRRKSLSLLAAWLSEFIIDLCLDIEENYSSLKKRRSLSKLWFKRFSDHHDLIDNNLIIEPIDGFLKYWNK